MTVMCLYCQSIVLLSCFQIVNLIEETGHFHITNTTFDFDLCSLDKTTVRKLQSYLETSGTSWKTCAAGCHEQEHQTSWLSSWFCLNQFVAMLWNQLHPEVLELLSSLCVPQRWMWDSSCPPGLHLKSLEKSDIAKKGITSSCAKKNNVHIVTMYEWWLVLFFVMNACLNTALHHCLFIEYDFQVCVRVSLCVWCVRAHVCKSKWY